MATTDLTEQAIRNAFREGVAEAKAEGDEKLALKIAEAKLAAAVRALDLAIAELVTTPHIYAGDAKGALLSDKTRRLRDDVEARLAEVQADVRPMGVRS